jgi:hypothetical protein
MAETTDFLSRMKESFKGVLSGIIMIPLSFSIVFYASQREQVSEVLEGAMPFEQAAEAAKKKKAVYMTGKLQADPIGDEYLKPGHYLSINREAQMYAYVSREETKEVEKNGKKEKQTVYGCVVEWTSDPGKADDGKACADENKTNPAQTLADFSKEITPSLIFNGKTWQLAENVIYTDMPGIELTADKLKNDYAIENNYLYPDPKCKTESPRIGCERLVYSGTSYDPAGEYTAIGTPVNDRIEGFVAKSGTSYLRVGPGKVDQVMQSLKTVDSMATIILFIISVLALGIGLNGLVGPFLELIEYIPIIGGLGAGLIRFVLFIAAAIVMGLSFLLIEYWYLVLLLFVAGVIAAIVIAKKRRATA